MAFQKSYFLKAFHNLLIPKKLVIDTTGKRNDNICKLKIERLELKSAENQMIRKDNRIRFKLDPEYRIRVNAFSA